MDLSKGVDMLNRDLLIAKLHAYGFSEESLQLIKSYLTNCWQRTKVNVSFSNHTELLLGVPQQGSVLEPLVFNIYINDLFDLTELTNVCNYTNDTTFHACDSDICSLIKRLEHDSLLAIEWFESNYMKLNKDKCHFIISGYKHKVMFANIGKVAFGKKGKKSLLELQSIKTLNLKNIFMKQCKKAGTNCFRKSLPYFKT